MFSLSTVYPIHKYLWGVEEQEEDGGGFQKEFHHY